MVDNSKIFKSQSPANGLEVAVGLPVDGTFTYLCPENLAALATAGKRVLVPFGRRKVTGYILGPAQNVERIKLKPILDILDEHPLFLPEMIGFFKWMSKYYKYPLGEVIKTALPSGINLYEQRTVWISNQGLSALKQGIFTLREEAVLKALSRGGEMTIKALERAAGMDIPYFVIEMMQGRGWIETKKQLAGGKTRHLVRRFVALTPDISPDKTGKLTPAKEKIVRRLEGSGEISVNELKEAMPTAGRHLKVLEENGFIRLSEKTHFRDPLGGEIVPDSPPELTSEQERVVSSILDRLDSGYGASLLAGVTGSGKTEVYLRLAEQVMERKKSVLVLVPEIALISQIERRFRARLGDKIAVLHSALSDGERLDQWVKIATGKVGIAMGARSCIFAPLKNLGLIIVDEEHEASYKQESRFRYNARDLAVVRAKLCGCTVLLGSATPSVQSYYNVAAGKYQEHYLRHRIEKRPLAEITVVDLKKDLGPKGGRRIISAELASAMKQTLDKKEQVLLFLNRRGFASFPVCGGCGKALKCRNCEITLTLHKSLNAYQCHFCGYMLPATAGCPSCQVPRIKQLGLGTEKLEGMVKSMYPKARVARLDRDTTRAKGSMVKILKRLRDHEIDVLIGTQMVAKGHDFPNITLVGIICADMSLNIPDFRSGERTFQILAQVAGRAGRGELPGRVILQTYNPNHFSIIAARDQDFKRFHDQEILFRKTLNYPPYSRLVQMEISGKDKKNTGVHARHVGDAAKELRDRLGIGERVVEILGPIEAPLVKLAGRYRWQLLLKASDPAPLHRLVDVFVLKNAKLLTGPRVRVAIDVDPCDML